MVHHMVVRKEKKVKKNTPMFPHQPKEEPELVPKAGRASVSYRGSRRNLFRPIDSEKHNEVIYVRSLNQAYTRLGEYGAVYKTTHPEFIRQISNRGEVHYVPDREADDSRSERKLYNQRQRRGKAVGYERPNHNASAVL